MRRNAPASWGRSGFREVVGQGASEDAPSESRWDMLRVCNRQCHDGQRGKGGQERKPRGRLEA